MGLTSLTVSQAKGSTWFFLQLPKKEYIMAARLAAWCDPANKKFFLPKATLAQSAVEQTKATLFLQKKR